MEKHYIKWLKPHYNLKEGGQGGTHSNISKEKMSKSQKGIKRNRTLEGKKEWCEKLSISNITKHTFLLFVPLNLEQFFIILNWFTFFEPLILCLG